MKNLNLIKNARWLMAVIAIVTIGVGQMWGGETTYTMCTDCSAGKTIEDNWTADKNASFNASGAYWGCTASTGNTVVITCTSISSPITEIVVSGKRNKNYAYTISATVGGASFGSDYEHSDSSGDYITNTLSESTGKSGTIQITLVSAGASSGGGSIWVASITVTTVDNHTVTYNANGGSGNVPIDANSPYAPSSSVTVLGNIGSPALSRTNCTFAGWNTAADGSGTSYTAGNTFTISANTTLYAKWTATVVWKSDGYTLRTDADQVIPAAGKSITPPAVPNPGEAHSCGNKFMGWTTTENYSDNNPPAVLVNGAQTVTGDVTYYAVWADYAE